MNVVVLRVRSSEEGLLVVLGNKATKDKHGENEHALGNARATSC